MWVALSFACGRTVVPAPVALPRGMASSPLQDITG